MNLWIRSVLVLIEGFVIRHDERASLLHLAKNHSLKYRNLSENVNYQLRVLKGLLPTVSIYAFFDQLACQID